MHDCPTIYHVPLALCEQGLVQLLSSKLCLKMPVGKPRKFMGKWRSLAERAEHLRKDVRIALVGKYTKLEDAYASVIKALTHAAMAANYRLRLTYIAAADLEDEAKSTDPVLYHEAWKKLCECEGVLVPGGFGKRGVEGKIAASQWARHVRTFCISTNYLICNCVETKTVSSISFQDQQPAVPWHLPGPAVRRGGVRAQRAGDAPGRLHRDRPRDARAGRHRHARAQPRTGKEGVNSVLS